MDGEIEAAVRRLIDKDEIIDLVHRYSYCVDHRLYDEVVDLFTEDCVVDYGPAFAPVHSRPRLRQMFGHPGAGFAATSHHNANILVTFEDPDRASVNTSVYAWHRRADGTTPRLWGYYLDSVVRLPEGWRIARRQLRTLGSKPGVWRCIRPSRAKGGRQQSDGMAARGRSTGTRRSGAGSGTPRCDCPSEDAECGTERALGNNREDGRVLPALARRTTSRSTR